MFHLQSIKYNLILFKDLILTTSQMENLIQNPLNSSRTDGGPGFVGIKFCQVDTKQENKNLHLFSHKYCKTNIQSIKVKYISELIFILDSYVAFIFQ